MGSERYGPGFATQRWRRVTALELTACVDTARLGSERVVTTTTRRGARNGNPQQSRPQGAIHHCVAVPQALGTGTTRKNGLRPSRLLPLG